MQSYFPNILVSFGSIVLTVVIIENILERNNQKESERIAQVIKKQEYVDFLDIAGNEFTAFRSSIAHRYIIFITKSSKMPGNAYDNPKEYLLELINNIDNYIDANFYKEKYEVMEPSPSLEPIYKTLDYQEYCFIYFKHFIFQQTDSFLSRYISIMPKEQVKNILKINNILKGVSFFTMLEKNIIIDMSNIQFDVEGLRKEIKELGEIIIKLFDDIEQN